MGRYGDKARHAEGRMVVDFKTRMEMAVLNNYFKEKEKHRVTYKSGGRSTQVDYRPIVQQDSNLIVHFMVKV